MWINSERYRSPSTPAQPTYFSAPVPTVREDILNVQADGRLAAHLRETPAPHILEEIWQWATSPARKTPPPPFKSCTSSLTPTLGSSLASLAALRGFDATPPHLPVGTLSVGPQGTPSLL